MADEPNKKMDELLRAYADERRKAPELYLHPATRKMLQGEVSRVIGKPEGNRTWRDRMRAFWPQIAFGGALCFVLGIAVLSLRQGPPEKPIQEENASQPAAGASIEQQVRGVDEALGEAQLRGEKRLNENLGRAVAEIGQGAPKPEGPVPALQPAQEGVVQLDRFYESELRLRQDPAEPQAPQPLNRTAMDVMDVSLGAPVLLQAEAPKAQAPKPDAQRFTSGSEVELFSIAPEPPVVLGDEVRSFREPAQDAAAKEELESLQKKTVSATPAAVPAPNLNFRSTAASQAPGRARELTNLGAARRLYFVQATNGVAGAAAPMFSSFQVELTGKELKVMDRDGSVYLGIIEMQTNSPSAPVSSALAVTRQRFERVQETAPKPTNSAEYSITVRGTNRTLRENVVLTGRMFERTNAGRLPVERLSAPATTAPEAMGARPPEPAPRMMIIGNAVVGSTNQVPVRAYSREP